MDATTIISEWLWWGLLLFVAAMSAWGLVGAARTGRVMLVRDWGFARGRDPFEFWFLVSVYLIVVVGVIWMLLEGWGPLRFLLR